VGMSFEQRGMERGGRADRRSTEGSVRRGVEEGGAIKLHIERLTLHGFSPADRHQIADQVQGELLRLLREGGGLQAVKNSMSVERAEAESFPHPERASAQTTGEQIARAVYRGLKTSAAAPHGLSRTRTGAAGRGGKR
jgi:hypothetical protein